MELRRLLLVVVLAAGLVQAGVGCFGESELNPQPLPPAPEDDHNRKVVDEPVPAPAVPTGGGGSSSASSSASSSTGGIMAGPSTDAGGVADAGDGGDR